MMPTTTQEFATARYVQAAAEIAGSANSNISTDAFVKGLLERVVAVVGARAAAVWGLSGQGVLAAGGRDQPGGNGRDSRCRDEPAEYPTAHGCERCG